MELKVLSLLSERQIFVRRCVPRSRKCVPQSLIHPSGLLSSILFRPVTTASLPICTFLSGSGSTDEILLHSLHTENKTLTPTFTSVFQITEKIYWGSVILASQISEQTPESSPSLKFQEFW